MAMQETMNIDQVKQLVSKKRKFKAGRDNTRYGKRHIPGQMNKTEEKFAELLYGMQLKQEIIGWEFEPMSFRYATGGRYTPDFMVTQLDYSLTFYDVKINNAKLLDSASIARLMATAEKFWQFSFKLAKYGTVSKTWTYVDY